jgi:hypothetical protein
MMIKQYGSAAVGNWHWSKRSRSTHWQHLREPNGCGCLDSKLFVESPSGSIAVALGRLEVFGAREVPATRRDILRGGAPLEQHLARTIAHNHLDRAVEEPLGVDPAHDDTVGIAL